jgi:hypothetical protein
LRQISSPPSPRRRSALGQDEGPEVSRPVAHPLRALLQVLLQDQVVGHTGQEQRHESQANHLYNVGHTYRDVASCLPRLKHTTARLLTHREAEDAAKATVRLDVCEDHPDRVEEGLVQPEAVLGAQPRVEWPVKWVQELGIFLLHLDRPVHVRNVDGAVGEAQVMELELHCLGATLGPVQGEETGAIGHGRVDEECSWRWHKAFHFFELVYYKDSCSTVSPSEAMEPHGSGPRLIHMSAVYLRQGTRGSPSRAAHGTPMPGLALPLARCGGVPASRRPGGGWGGVPAPGGHAVVCQGRAHAGRRYA